VWRRCAARVGAARAAAAELDGARGDGQ
jgi:hypothetical protein